MDRRDAIGASDAEDFCVVLVVDGDEEDDAVV